MKGDLVCKLNEELALVREQLRQSEASAAVMREAFGKNNPWTLWDVIKQLELAAHHLLEFHDCDHEGHENTSRCLTLVSEYRNKISKVFSTTAGQSFLDQLEEARVLLSEVPNLWGSVNADWLTQRDTLLEKMRGGR